MIKRLKVIASKTEIGEKAVSDRQFRTALFACFNLAFNLLYAIYNGVTGVITNSLWYITMFSYYAVLSLLRFYVVTYELRKKSKRTDVKLVHFCGGWLITLGLILVGMVCLDITLGQDTSKPMIMMIASAAYTTFKAVRAVINTVKAAKSGSAVMMTLRNISCSDAAASLLTLEHSMMYTFGDGHTAYSDIFDIVTGTLAVVTVIALGVSLLMQSKRLKENKNKAECS